MKIVKPSVDIWAVTPNAEQLIERAGRICYKSEDKIGEGSAAKFIKMLLTMTPPHESVIEHASATLHIICDRGISHEAVRHRLASFSQESTRYCSYAKEKFGSEISVIEPPGLRRCSRHDISLDSVDPVLCCPWYAWYFITKQSERAYMMMVESGISPQIARSILPTCLKTEFAITANFREWRHVIKMRTSPKAHPQMIEIATMIRDRLVEVAPSVFGDL